MISHYLRPNASTAIPSRLVFVDTETRPREIKPGLEEHELRLGVATFWQRAGNKVPERTDELVFRHAEQFWAWLERRVTDGKRVVVFAHNTSFDLQVLGGPQDLRRRGWDLRSPIIDSERVIIRAHQGRRHMLWLDWYNFFRAPLEKAAELLGLEYVPLPRQADDDELWLARCRNDVRILRAAVARWIEILERNELGHFSPTLASQAMHAFRHRYMEHEILILKPEQRPRLERASYMGGRTEAAPGTWREGGPFYLVDVNSMYAEVMGKYRYPRRILFERERTSRHDLPELLKHHMVIAEVELDTEVPIWPTHHEERLVFPVGRFWTTLTTPELLEAVRRRVITRVGRLVCYEGAELFSKWSREIYALRIAYRREGDLLAADLCSNMLQALYGKFGEHRRRWEKVGDEPELPDEVWTERDVDRGRERVYRRLAGVVTERDDDEEGQQAMPAIPAHVTAYARLELWHWSELAGAEHVYYRDTDALIVDAAGFAQLRPYVDPDRLGYLKVVTQGEVARIEAPKVYEIGDEHARKGIRADAELTAEGKYRQRQFVGLNAQLRRGHSGGPLVETVEISPARAPARDALEPAWKGRIVPLRLP